MPYNEQLAERVRAALPMRRVTERKMFGGLTFMVDGHMCVGIVDDTLMVRVGPEAHEKAVTLKHARPMDFTGKPMRGFVFVDPPGIKTKRQLEPWVQRGLGFVKSQPAKKKK